MIYKAKKSLGQNFLKSQGIIKKIIEAGEIEAEDMILEIGPGKGALTEKILEAGGRVIAIEKDSDLIPVLQEKFESEISNHSLILVHGDALQFKPEDYGLKSYNYKIIANIPYNITGAVFKKFLSEEIQPERMILMVQKEVADRILARDGKESLLSIGVKAYGTPKLVVKAPKRYFNPQPKVDSAVVSVKGISRRVFESSRVSEEKFWQIVRAGFAHKRKILAGNLKIIDKNTDWGGVIAKTIGKEKARAEELALYDWIELLKSS